MRIIASLIVVTLCGLPGAYATQDPSPSQQEEFVTTASGLKYLVLTPGEGGEHPALDDTVFVYYTGRLENGKVFDSTEDRSTPVKFVVSRVIPGWAEGLTLMTPGARYKFIIPYDLAYGSRGNPPNIPPYSELIFEVELVKFDRAPVIPTFHPPDKENQEESPDGLLYEVVTPGNGIRPRLGQWIQVRFALWNQLGEIVDCSAMQGSDFKFKLGEYSVPAMNEGVQLMDVGSKYRFEVPPELGFGERGAKPQIGPDEVTYWEIELVKVLVPLEPPRFTPPSEDRFQVTNTGLRYEILKEGKGPSPQMGQKVTVQYAGWLLNGSCFDSSFERGSSTTFQLGRVIPGWNEGLQLMKEGAIFRFLIPPNLAYGPRGNPPSIPPDAPLLFYIELLEVEEGD